jgi:hypothetical protein
MFQYCIAALFAGPGCRTDPSCSNNSKRAAATTWATWSYIARREHAQYTRYCTSTTSKHAQPTLIHDGKRQGLTRTTFTERGASLSRCEYAGGGGLGRQKQVRYWFRCFGPAEASPVFRVPSFRRTQREKERPATGLGNWAQSSTAAQQHTIWIPYTSLCTAWPVFAYAAAWLPKRTRLVPYSVRPPLLLTDDASQS